MQAITGSIRGPYKRTIPVKMDWYEHHSGCKLSPKGHVLPFRSIRKRCENSAPNVASPERNEQRLPAGSWSIVSC